MDVAFYSGFSRTSSTVQWRAEMRRLIGVAHFIDVDIIACLDYGQDTSIS